MLHSVGRQARLRCGLRIAAWVAVGGGAVTHKGGWRIWRAAADGGAVPAGEGGHELWHIHASVLIAGGASPVAVAHRLGHRDAIATLKTYGHLWPDDDARMREATDGLIRLP